MNFAKLLVVATLAAIAVPGDARTYTLTELTVVTRVPLGNIYPTAISDSGVVIGNASAGYLQSTALFWTVDGNGRVLRPIDSVNSRANAINTAGKVVGTAEYRIAGNTVTEAFVYDPATDSYSFPVGPGSTGNDINVHGQIVGQLNGKPFFFDPVAGVRTYELPPGIINASFNGITDDGHIIGIRAAETPLGIALSSTSFVLANADGTIPGTPMNPTLANSYLSRNNAGQYATQTSVVNAPFFFAFNSIGSIDGSPVTNFLGKLPGDDTNYGGGFNDFLDIVGESYNENRYGGSYGDGIITTRTGETLLLSSLVTNLGGYFIQQGQSINNFGVIAAFGRGQSFILTPDDLGPPTPGVPEPASWALLIAGFGLTGAAMRRRAARAVVVVA